MFDLTGMTALVTGASGGIGSAIAQALAGQGARLAVSGSNVDKLEAFRTGLGGDHVALPCNLSDGAAVDALVPQAVEALGQLDILVNNAGVTRDNLAMRMKDEEWSDVITVNLEAAFRLARAARPAWVVAKGGITSHDVAVRGLGIRRAEVLGQLFPGIVSVLRPIDAPPEVVGVPYVVFAGNVGNESTLADVVDRFRGSH